MIGSISFTPGDFAKLQSLRDKDNSRPNPALTPAQEVPQRKEFKHQPELVKEPKQAEPADSSILNRPIDANIEAVRQNKQEGPFPPPPKVDKIERETNPIEAANVKTQAVNQEIHAKESRQEFAKQEIRKQENEEVERQHAIDKEQVQNELKVLAERDDARRKFFEDLARFKQGQTKLSEVFQQQSNLPFIGKHADLTA